MEYAYDSQGRMVTMTTWQDFSGDAGKAVTTWTYDPARGLLAAKRDADSKEVKYLYTAAGRLDTRTWARLFTPSLPHSPEPSPLVTTYAYHPDGALASVDYADATPDITYAYHRHGQVHQVRDGVLTDGTISDTDLRYRHTYAYDAAVNEHVELTHVRACKVDPPPSGPSWFSGIGTSSSLTGGRCGGAKPLHLVRCYEGW